MVGINFLYTITYMGYGQNHPDFYNLTLSWVMYSNMKEMTYNLSILDILAINITHYYHNPSKIRNISITQHKFLYFGP